MQHKKAQSAGAPVAKKTNIWHQTATKTKSTALKSCKAAALKRSGSKVTGEKENACRLVVAVTVEMRTLYFSMSSYFFTF